MATTAKIAKDLKKPKFQVPAPQPLLAVRAAAGLLRKFELCRICFRKLALAGEIPGVIKASW